MRRPEATRYLIEVGCWGFLARLCVRQGGDKYEPFVILGAFERELGCFHCSVATGFEARGLDLHSLAKSWSVRIERL